MKRNRWNIALCSIIGIFLLGSVPAGFIYGQEANARITIIQERKIDLGDLGTGDLKKVIFDAAWQPNGQLLAIGFAFSSPGEIQIWNTSNGTLAHRLIMNATLEEPNLSWSSDGGKLAVVYADPMSQQANNMYIWDVSLESTSLILSERHADDYSYSMAIAWGMDNDQIISFRHAETNSIRIWDIPQKTIVNEFSDSLEGVLSFTWNPLDVTMALGLETGQVELADRTLNEIRTLPRNETFVAPIDWIEWTPDYSYLTAISFGFEGIPDNIWTWDMSTGQSKIPTRSGGDIRDQEFHPTRNILTTLTEPFQNTLMIEFWEVSDGVYELGHLDAPDESIAISWGSSNNFAVVTNNNSIVVWELEIVE